MALQTYANARAYLNANEALPSLTQRTEIHERSRPSTEYAVCCGKRLDLSCISRTSLVDGKWNNGRTLFFVLLTQRTGSCDAKLPTHNTKHVVVNHRSGQTADT